MNRDLWIRVAEIGRALRGIFGPPYSVETKQEIDMANTPTRPRSKSSIREASAEMSAGADHLLSVAAAVRKETENPNPDDFEASMQQLLGRLH